MSDTFIEKFKTYKSLNRMNYKYNNLLTIIDYLLLLIPGLTLVMLSLNGYIYSFFGLLGVIFCTIVSYAVCYVGNAMPIGFFTYKYEKMINTECYLMNKKFTGSLSEIFDMNCEITREVLKDCKEILENQLYDSKGINGAIIMSLWDNISQKKEQQARILSKKENIQVLINANTKIGKALQELNQLGQ